MKSVTRFFRDLDPGTGLHRSAIHLINIHKEHDGPGGGWLLAGVRVCVNGDEIYDNQASNQCLKAV